MCHARGETRCRCACLQVERYFTLNSALPTSYWIGINRTSTSAFYTYLDGTTVPQFASRSPWAHWGATQYIYAFSPYVYNCGAAFSSAAYDM